MQHLYNPKLVDNKLVYFQMANSETANGESTNCKRAYRKRSYCKGTARQSPYRHDAHHRLTRHLRTDACWSQRTRLHFTKCFRVGWRIQPVVNRRLFWK